MIVRTVLPQSVTVTVIQSFHFHVRVLEFHKKIAKWAGNANKMFLAVARTNDCQ